MLYELRHYDTHSVRSLDTLTRRFGDHVLRLWSKAGIEPVGFWSTLVGTPSPRLTYLLAWEDLGQRQTRWDQFTADPEWHQVQDETNARAGGSPTRAITSTILKPAPFSHLPRHDNQPMRYDGGIFELREYVFDDAGKQRQTQDWFCDGGQAHFEKHGMFVMGVWTTYLGVGPRLTYMLLFENLAHRERAWASYYTDPAWTRLQDGLYPDGRPLIFQTESRLMKGTEFSNWR